MIVDGSRCIGTFLVVMMITALVDAQTFTNSSTLSSSTLSTSSSISITSSGEVPTTSMGSGSATSSSTSSTTTISSTYIAQATYTADITIIGDVTFGELKVESGVTLTLLNGNNYTFLGGMETKGDIIITKSLNSYPGVIVNNIAPYWFQDGSFTVLDSNAKSASKIVVSPYYFSMSGSINFDLSRVKPGNITLGFFVSTGTFTFASALIEPNRGGYNGLTKRASIGSMINNGKIFLKEGSTFSLWALSGSGTIELDNGNILVPPSSTFETKVSYAGPGTLVIDEVTSVQNPLTLDGFTGDDQLAIKGGVASVSYQSGILKVQGSSGYSWDFAIGNNFDSRAFNITPGIFSYAGQNVGVNYINYGHPPPSGPSTNSTSTSKSTSHSTSSITSPTTSVYTTTITSGTTSTVVIFSCVPTTDARGKIYTVTYTLPCPYTTTVTFSSCSLDKCTAITTTRTVTPTTTTISTPRCRPSIKTVYVVIRSTILSCPSSSHHSKSSTTHGSSSSHYSTTSPTHGPTFNQTTSLSTFSPSSNQTVSLPPGSVTIFRY